MQVVVRRAACAVLVFCLHVQTSFAQYSQCARELALFSAVPPQAGEAGDSQETEAVRTLTELFSNPPPLMASGLFPNVPADTKPRSEQEHWKESGLKFDALKTLVNNEACYRSQIQFLMCVAALRTLTGFGDETAVLLPLQHEELKEYFGKTIHEHGRLALVQLKEVSIQDPLLLAKYSKKLRIAIREAWLRAFQSRSEAIDFDDAMDWLKSTYLVSDREAYMTAVAINQAILEADAHGRIQTLSSMYEHQQGASERVVGIGVMLAKHGRDTVIREVREKGPAHRAGLQPGDILARVDSKEVSSLSQSQLTALLRGKEGSSVSLTIQRAGKTLEFTIERREISVPNVEASLYERGSTKIGYVRVHSFLDRGVSDKIEGRIRRLVKRGAQTLILDLRSNPGGLMRAAVETAGLFLGPDKPVITEKSLLPGIPDKIHFTRRALFTGIPLVVLINPSSASASELLSGALQDYGRAVIVGERSFGKGSVQHPKDLSATDGAFAGLPLVFWQTGARFYLPSGRTNQLHGITPDFVVYRTPGASEEEQFALREEDLHLNALASVGEGYKPQDGGKTAWLAGCLASEGLAERQFTERRPGSLPLDYQLLYAADVAKCLERWEKEKQQSGLVSLRAL